MSIRKTLCPLLRTGSTQEDRSGHDGNIVDWDVKNQNKQKSAYTINAICRCIQN